MFLAFHHPVDPNAGLNSVMSRVEQKWEPSYPTEMVGSCGFSSDFLLD